jgi:hypothetical protein
MDLILLILIFAGVGYLIGASRFGKRVEDTTGQLTQTSGRAVDNFKRRWRMVFKKAPKEEYFRDWVAGTGASLFPEEFKAWLMSLSPQECRAFTSALNEYSNSLGFSLTTLVNGGLDQDPMLRQVFVEAVVVYSSAYRKAKTARQES